MSTNTPLDGDNEDQVCLRRDKLIGHQAKKSRWGGGRKGELKKTSVSKARKTIRERRYGVDMNMLQSKEGGWNERLNGRSRKK